MGNSIIALLALALLSSAAYADYSAYFSHDSYFAINADNTGFPGHFGNYSVSVHVFPYPSYITVYGEGANQQALASEIAWLSENKLLQTECNSSAIYALSYVDYYCAPAGQWQDCDQSKECTKTPLPPGAPGATETGQPIEQKSPAPEAPGIMGIAENPVPMLTSAKAAPQAADTAGARSLAAGEQQPISLNQLLPLLGAFLAVIVLSYLVLQQRQFQLQIDPQEERLLSNGTRAGIMQELQLADKIPTDLSMRLGKSKATIVEHLEALQQAGFVEKLATPGRKFVFYRLTRKGKQALLRRAG